MSAHAPGRESCRKRGVILTCYVNGRKRFRAVPLSSSVNQSQADASPTASRGNGSSGLSVAFAVEANGQNR